jgi:hypothetical protein
MSPTFPLLPTPAPLFGEEPTSHGEQPMEREAVLTEEEESYLAGLSEDTEWGPFESLDVAGEWSESAPGTAGTEYLDGEWEDLTEPELFDDSLEFLEDTLAPPAEEWFDEASATDDDAERVVAALSRGRSVQEGELEVRRRPRLTRCLTAADVAETVRLYEQNDDAGASDPPDQHVDRASCIVMLNVGLGRLLSLRTVDHPARGHKRSMPHQPRTVRMGALTVESVDGALNQLVRKGLATGPLVLDFVDRRGKRAGTLAPVSLRSSVSDAVTRRAPDSGCWYGFGLSLLDATHSVLLLVDFSGSTRRIFWLDQFTRGLSREVTTSLDAEITSFTQRLWQTKLDTKKVRFSTTVRLWQLRKRVP